MKSTVRMLRGKVFCLFILIAVLGCGTIPTDSRIPGDMATQGQPEKGDSLDLSTVEWDEERIHDGDTITYLVIADFPCPISVSEHSTFRAASSIRDVEPSPDGRMLAIRTNNVSHEAGWLYDPHDGDPRPVAFQYGGEMDLVGWRGDGDYVAFIERTPGPGDFLRLVEVSERHEYVTDYGVDIGPRGANMDLPDHRGGMEGRIDPAGWRGQRFFFHYGDAVYSVDPEERVLEDAEEEGVHGVSSLDFPDGARIEPP